MFDLFGRQRRAKLRAAPFPSDWAALLDAGVPLVAALAAADRRELEGHIAVFVAEKHFEGAGGLTLTDTMRVTIAAQACLLLLHRGVERPYPSLDTVLVYPRAWRADARRARDGIVTEGPEGRSGESWRRGLVILSWDDTRRGAADPDDGHNVVLHEFAHQLDAQTGATDGAPPLPDRAMWAPWARVLGGEYEALIADLHRGRPTELDAYAATSPAEFFAVVTEAFFERGAALRARHSELYAQLAAFYRQDPASWKV